MLVTDTDLAVGDTVATELDRRFPADRLSVRVGANRDSLIIAGKRVRTKRNTVAHRPAEGIHDPTADERVVVARPRCFGAASGQRAANGVFIAAGKSVRCGCSI